MCSIPGLPMPGTEIPVLLTRVNLNPDFGLVELWVNMDDGRKHIYNQLREEIQIPQRKFYGSEGNPGDLCLVCISEAWHRARIVSIQSETYNVFLIDQGQSHFATSEALAWGNSDSFLLPPEIESCILANVLSIDNNWPERVIKFLKSLPGKKFKGLVQHVLMPDRTILLDIPIVSKHMCRFGVAKKIPSDEFKCLVLKCLHLPKADSSVACHMMQEQNLNVSFQLEKHGQYFYPELLTDTFETVTVTEVIHPNKIFFQLLIFSKAVKILLGQLHQHYEESSDSGDAQPQKCGDPCAAKGTNGRWHRSLLKQNTVTSDGAVEVLHVDKGKTEIVPVRDIRPLHGKFLRMPVVTYLCSLNGVKDNGTGWNSEQTDYLKSLLLNQTVVARFDQHTIPQDVYYVTVYAANAACINERFMEKSGLLPPSKSEQDPNVKKAQIPSPFVSALEDEQYMDFENKINVEVDYLQEETLPSTKSLEVNGKLDDVPTSGASDIHFKESLKHSDALTHNDERLSAGFHYSYSTHNIEVGEKEKVWITFAANVHHFFCQLERNSHLFDKVMENISELTGKTQGTDHPLGPDGICIARHSDGQWYRGQIVEMSPKIKVHFVDCGDTLAVSKGDICPFPSEACTARSVPVQAVQLALFDVPEEVPQEVNQWFADHAVGNNLTILVVAKGTKEKLVVELFDGSVNFNVKVREKISNMRQQKMSGLDQQPDQQLSNSSEESCVPNEDYFTQEHIKVQVLTKQSTEQKKIDAREELNISPQSISVSVPESEYEETLDEGREPSLDVLLKNKETVMTGTIIKGSHDDCEITQLSPPPRPEDKVNIFKRPNISQDKTEEVYASYIVGPHYFWCQYLNNEDVKKLSWTAQEVGSAKQDILSPETLDLGSPCLALFSSDNLWRRAQVVQRTGHDLHVLFVDNGNESVVDISNVRSLPVGLLEMAPQAFLCYLNGFDKSKGSWEDSVYDDFYDILIKSKVFNTEYHPEIGVPHYAVNIECDGVVVNGLMQKYWKPFLIQQAKTEISQTESVLQGGQTVSNITQLNISTENVNTCLFKKQNISKNETVEVYASVIVEPHFFWCQYAKTDNLNKVSVLAQEAGLAQQDVMFLDSLSSGSQCLALFSSDKQWYRAKVIKRTGDTLHVLFVDYGNESDVDIKDVRSLPQSLLEVAPQAFLCYLNGFDRSKGSWDDQVYEDFYSLLVDKPFKLTVLNSEDHLEIAVPQYAVQIEDDNLILNDAMQKYWKSVSTEHVMTKKQTENIFQSGQTEPDMTCPNFSEENVDTCMYNKRKNKRVEVYASCIVDPHFFWCQYANTEDLSKVSVLVQEAGLMQQDVMFLDTLGPGSPCLALFSSDNQWYRAQVIQRTCDTVHVLFVDYGNESDIDLKNVKSLPVSLLEMAPQAFLCSLKGFDESKGSWDDQCYDDFYSLLVDKPLKLTVLNIKDHSELAVPHYTVQIECGNVIVNEAMQKYWKPTAMDHVITESPKRENLLQRSQTEANTTLLNASKENICMYKKPKISKTKMEIVYASCIAEPNFFWCQYANTEDLSKVLRLAQEAGQAHQDVIDPETIDPGSPCLALFSSDNQWYRAQVIRKNGDAVHVLFVDYGNESDTDIKDVRSLPQSLLEMAPQAFLCCLNGFDGSKGSWDEQVYDDFYNLLLDKPLKVTVFNMKDHPEIAVSQYAVEIECEGVIVNTLMEKYWKKLDTEQKVQISRSFESVDQDGTRTMDESVGVKNSQKTSNDQ